MQDSLQTKAIPAKLREEFSLLCLTNLVKMTAYLDTLESDKHEFLNITIL